MHSVDGLRDIHERSQRSLLALLDQARALTSEEVDRELAGFGFATVRLQFHHIIGAEKYWLGVLEGHLDADEDAHLYPSIEALMTYREEISARTENYLCAASTDELNTPRSMTTWGGRERTLTPAQVVLRTQTHIFHHLGQISAMLRLLGKPSTGADYPIT